MFRPRLALLLLMLSVLLPIQALAQTPPPLVPAPTQEEPSPSGEEYPEFEEEPQDERIPREWARPESSGLKVSRIMLELLGGATLGIVGGVPGAALAVGAAFCDGCGSTGGFLAGVALSFAGLTVGSALGIKALGSLLDGEGRFLSTLAGSSLGGLAGLGLGMIIGFAAGSELWFIPVLAGPIVGGIIAYESSHADSLQKHSAEPPPEVSVIPVFSVSPRGGIIGGLVGRF
jgi:hypothetical protein